MHSRGLFYFEEHMICYQFQCEDCKGITDGYFNMSERPDSIKCQCGGTATRIITIPGANMVNESPDWVKSIREVVDKEGGQHCQTFLKDPTRENYKNWMKVEGVRHLEQGEPLFTRPAQKEITPDQLMKYRQEKRSIECQTRNRR